MPLHLPPPDTRPLLRSPLAVTVCQIRYEEVPSVSDTRIMLAIQKELGGRTGPYPVGRKQQTQPITIQAGPTGPQPILAAQQTGWRLASRDERWIVSLMPQHASLETTAYTSWEGEFRTRLSTLIDAVAQHIAPEVEQRLGLRYINRITDPEVTTPPGWRDFIAPEFLGAILHPHLGQAITVTQQQIDLEVAEGVHCTVRHGCFSDGDRPDRLTYLLDFDIYREGLQSFDPTGLKEAADMFNTWALQLFQQAVTPRMRDFLAADHG